ncbi:MAG: response regulator transcription factor [Acidobacteriota bacterium]|nr:response regulator transcription factor [Acidobacteriota bacterium]
MTRILVVEDEPGIAFALDADLRSEGYAVTIATTGDEALRLAGSATYELILLDVMLPGKDGFEVCRKLRRSEVRTPIILLTAKSHEAEKVMGLEMGADDYVTKPFSPRELRARIKAVLRRSTDEPGEVVRFGDIDVSVARCEVHRGGQVVDLSALEFKLLTAFVRSRGRVLTREQLLDEAWGRGVVLNDRVVDNHIVGLRRKLEADPTKPRHFLNIRGLGYRFDV